MCYCTLFYIVILISVPYTKRFSDLAWGAYSAPPDSLSGFWERGMGSVEWKGLRMEKATDGKGKDGEEKEGEGMGELGE